MQLYFKVHIHSVKDCKKKIITFVPKNDIN